MNFYFNKDKLLENATLVDGILNTTESMECKSISLNTLLESNPLDLQYKQLFFQMLSSEQTLENKIWDILSNKSIQSVKKPLDVKSKEEYLQKIRFSISEGSAIKFVMIAFPFKATNPFKTNRTHPDFGELVMLMRMHTLAKIVEMVYPPGLHWTILTESTLYQEILGAPLTHSVSYINGIKEFVKSIGASNHISFEELASVCNRHEQFSQTVQSIESELDIVITQPQTTEAIEHQKILWTMLFSVNMGSLDLLQLCEYHFSLSQNKSLEEISKVWPDMFQSAVVATKGYLALNRARAILAENGGNLISDMFPEHCYLSLTQKNNRYCFISLSGKNIFLPHHGVPVLEGERDNQRVIISPLADVLFSKNHKYCAWYLDGDKENKPFYYARI